MLYPIYDAISKSFFDWRMTNYYTPTFIGIENYVQIFNDPLFWKSCLTVLIFLAWGFFVTIAIVVPVTFLVYRLGEGGWGRFVQRAYVIPMMVPTMVITLYWKLFYEPSFGMLNRLLTGLGKAGLTHVWLGEKATAIPALLFVGFPWVSSFSFLVLLAGFQAIDESLHEAAELDGASTGRRFFAIDIPLVVPQLKVLIILGFIEGLQQFNAQLILTNGGPNYQTTVPGLLVYQNAFTFGKLGYGAAIGVILFLVIFLFTLLTNKYIRRAG
jgi:raffinose/stachyose/melibiose transport system permease protein